MHKKEWTIMIYMAGDNNLSVDMAYALEQIKQVAGDSDESPNLFVYYDGNSPAIPTLYCDFSERNDPKYVRSFRVPDKLYPVPVRQNENAADNKSVLNFVNWCVNQVEVVDENGEITNGRRANKYALIFSGHSLGFQDIGLFRDETSGKAMKMSNLYRLLRRLVGTADTLVDDINGSELTDEERVRDTRVLLGQNIDLLGFDSCVMGMLEVGYQFNDVAEVMIASEGSVPNAGWTYAKLLGKLAGSGSNNGSTAAVAESFVRDFIKAQDSYTVGGVSVDMAAWDLNCLRDLATAFDGLATVLIECFSDPQTRVYRQMRRAILHVHWTCQSYMYDQNVDLGDFCELLDRECGSILEELGEGDDLGLLLEVQNACCSVLEELNKAVILSGFSGGYYQYSNGISVFFPWSRECYEASRENYQSLLVAKKTGSRKFQWNNFLKKYLSEIARRPSEPTTPDALPGSRYRYISGITFHEPSLAFAAAAANGGTKIPGQEGSKMPGQEGSKMPGQEGSKIPGQEGSKMPGQEGSKMPGQEGSKMPGQEGSKMPGQEGSKMPGQEGSKMPGHEGSKMPGQEGSKIPGQEGSKIPGQEGSKMPGQEGSKMPGQEGSKMPGQEGSKIPGQEGSKIPGQEGSKMPGQEGSKLAIGGGSSSFFQSLRLFKNIEGQWNVSGFTKRKIDE